MRALFVGRVRRVGGAVGVVVVVAALLPGCTGLDADGRGIVAVDARTGEELWDEPEPRSYFFGAVAGDRLLLVDGWRLLARDAETGRELWHTRAPAPRFDVAGDLIVSTGLDKAVSAFDVATGARRWSTRAPELRGVVASAEVVAGVDEDGLVVALDPGSGRVRWRSAERAAPDGPDGHRSARVAPGVVVVPSAAGPWVALDASTGVPRWSAAACRDGFGADAVPVFVCAAGEVVVGLDPATGQERWRYPLGGRYTGGWDAGDRLVIKSDAGGNQISVLRAADGAVVAELARQPCCAVALVDDVVLFNDTTKGASAVAIPSGERRWTIDAEGFFSLGWEVACCAGSTAFLYSWIT